MCSMTSQGRPYARFRHALPTGNVRDLGIEIRAFVHTGECELIDGKPGGIAVTTGARIAALAEPSQVLVSRRQRPRRRQRLYLRALRRTRTKGRP
jgi:class 3 adenylate cyclase